jgi:N-acetylmuramic acid 6-phosphate (MurNAc-6-P) etherase
MVRCPEGDAARHFEQADGDVKMAILIGLGLARSEAAQLLQRHGGQSALCHQRVLGQGWLNRRL